MRSWLFTATGEISVANNATGCNSVGEITPPAGSETFSGNYVVTSERDIEVFCYTSITGNLIIDAANYADDVASLTTLNGLEGLTSIGGTLTIRGMSGLVNLNGLDNLSSVRGIVLNDLASLNNVNILSGVTSLDNSINITDAPNLGNFSGLSGLTSVGGSVTLDNIRESNLNDLVNLTSIGVDLVIRNNTSLSNIVGLRNVGDVRIFRLTNNPALINTGGLFALTVTQEVDIKGPWKRSVVYPTTSPLPERVVRSNSMVRT